MGFLGEGGFEVFPGEQDVLLRRGRHDRLGRQERGLRIRAGGGLRPPEPLGTWAYGAGPGQLLCLRKVSLAGAEDR